MRTLVKIVLLGSAGILAACGGAEGGPAKSSAAGANGAADSNGSTNSSASEPSFDCATAIEPAEKLICGDSQLAAMDREVARLYQLAIKDKSSVPTADALAMAQDEWITARNQCGADADLRSCIAWDYAERAHKLRQGSAAARAADPAGISDGPVAYRCKGLDMLISATYLNSDPGVVYLEWGEDSLALMQTASGSGAKYTAKSDEGDYSFWTKGEEAMFQRPGVLETTCAEEPIG